MNISDSMASGATTRNPADEVTPGSELGKEDFMNLLMVQLANQDPLSPMDNTQFVAQLSQFATLEQLNNMSGNLENMAFSQAANTSAQMVSFIGREVEVAINELHHGEGGTHNIGFVLQSDAAEVEITIKDESGNVVRTLDGDSYEQGEHSVTWDGLNMDGSPVPDGVYTIEVEATNSDDEPVGVSTRLTQTVIGVTYENGFPMLLLEGGGKASLGEIVNVTDGSESSSNETTE